ncbi:glutaminyl-peptide cyclotransferase family protein [Aspergillus clavatus NRRL 1]|uniref:Peptide hydrolase n=1 Tax=Aspergillus clavatus (strain ATCC 1007 / CBS 513.65 / DSM 816 / NCTC 3887 / NRRL 1 / QM 1276 / 107) TaxID=344612 RepID=A1CHE0_ASPCL|nr:glutaminyl cyclase, putative [Aspergillus clavatus NRRL 1]EAW10295.1 glutaminyl cyclase, putative [Aspergillus clavatus NRRL 1]
MVLAYGGFVRHLLAICLTLPFLLLSSAAYESLSDDTLRALPRPNNDFDIHNGALLAPILQTRIPGTPGSTAVLNHFADFFRTTLPDWKIEFQNSSSKTPLSHSKEVPFVNFIASRDPPRAAVGDVGRLTLVAHYDSKYEPKGFIGAIDSAAPCAMMMHTVRSIDAALTKKWAAMEAHGHTDATVEEQKGMQIIFLDGEEAFLEWTNTDSLYGARSLAEHWDEQVHPAMSIYKTPLSSISLFVLLDLLGSKDPSIQSYFATTHWAYQKLAALEKRLRDLKQFKSSSGGSSGASWFVDHAKNEHQLNVYSGIQDDHLPFLARGVEVLHIIDYSPTRRTGFPAVWHTIDDDGEHLDLETVEDWSMLFTAFAAEWMELEGFLPTGAEAQPKDKRSHPWINYSEKKTEL